MSRRAALAALLPALCIAAPLAAQDRLEGQTGTPPQRIDILVDPTPDIADLEGPLEDCSDEQEAASISGEIVVCRRRAPQSEHRLSSPDDAERRYAAATMDAGDPRAPDVAGPGIFRGAPTISGLCIIPPCPPPAAYMIDFDELPATPPGSDADRIARGLPPLGRDAAPAPPRTDQSALGLPPPPAADDPPAAEPVSPSGSASPAAER